jgi:hypothetical protein
VFQGEQKRMRRLLVLGQPKVKSTETVKEAQTRRTAKAEGDRAKLVAMVS